MISYRPISNLPFISKLLERYVARCLLDHMTANNLLERHQSAYKSHHLTDTALVLVQNDILGAHNRRFGVILVLLDMSAAFDTVNHEILLSRLEHRYGLAGSVLAWMRSYITVAYPKDRCWDLCCSLRTQLLSVILLGGTAIHQI
ncbi:hypothetical protein NP493_276g00000 [Ridgeia piscesae]|uniref:Reverse transcriptase domain-containing protein n=1 Tax=Ridgeia piscesae TaxID=27915 RepID=A0AAD9NXE0_RIDPI|nr:hypothetical protein NP493_276g00000 [Ridgeia piscesae]